jgi:outer membrane protein assembly factor BamB
MRDATSRPRLVAAAALIVGVGLPIGSAAAPLNWPQFHGRPTHVGFNTREQTVGVGNVFNLSLEWLGLGDASDFGVVFNSAPAIANGFAYFGDTNGTLYAFNANGCGQDFCSPVWKAPLVQSIYNSPAVADGIVYVGTSSTKGALFAFDAAGCGAHVCTTPLWQSTPLSVVDSSPTVANGVVYVGSGAVSPNGVYAFAAKGCGAPVCPPLWYGPTEGQVDNSPAVANGVLYAAGGTGVNDGKLYAFAAGGCGQPTCAPLWTAKLGAGTFASSPAVWNGVVYIGSYWDGKLNAFAAGGCGQPTCQPLWKGDAGTYVFSSPAVAGPTVGGGRVFIGSGDARLNVFDAAGCGQPLCQPLWTGYMVGGQAAMESPPMVANGVVYVGENNQNVAAFDASGCGMSECPPLWQYGTQGSIVNSSPVMVNGTLYVTGSNFGITPELYVFKLAITDEEPQPSE